MLSDHSPVPTLAVSDLERARGFYEGTLKLVPERSPAEDNPADGVVYTSGSGRILVYPSSYAGTNKATAVSFEVSGDAFDAEVDALRAAGIEFQTFELEGMEWDGGVASAGPMRAVWFTDPDGTILNLSTMG
jgi:catechol 2,3-dioxygenase-like lactoylglutathione lyase family enzyme